MTLDQLTSLLREFGFPVIVALWFMLRAEKRFDRLAELMNAHLQATALLAKSVDFHIDSTQSHEVAELSAPTERSDP